MKKVAFLVICLLFLLNGCGRKPKQKIETTGSPEDILKEENILMEEIAQSVEAEKSAAATQIETEAPVVSEQITVPETPSTQDIQVALKNAGLYEGEIDGVIGPRTKKAIESFQTQNNLVVDGKVGPKTWEKLKLFFNKAQQTAE